MNVQSISIKQINRHPNERRVTMSLDQLRITMLISLVGLIGLGLTFNLTTLDLRIAGIFADGVNGFPYSKYWLTDIVLHLYAARLTSLIGLSLILFNFWQWMVPSFNRKIIIACRYLMISWASSLLLISVLKKTTTLPCPWNLKQFGGTEDYLPIYDLFSSVYSVGYCFPSAHASGGYGLIGLGFIAFAFGLSIRKSFGLPILIGLLYGGTQIVRGAHFVSHDLFTIAICLLFAWFWAEAYLFWFQTNRIEKDSSGSLQQ